MIGPRDLEVYILEHLREEIICRTFLRQMNITMETRVITANKNLRINKYIMKFIIADLLNDKKEIYYLCP